MNAVYAGDAASLNPAVGRTVEEAYESMKRLMEPGVSYDVDFDDADGMFFKRFSRRLPVEAWLVAIPLNPDGSVCREKDCVVACIAVSLKNMPRSEDDRSTFKDLLIAQLRDLKASA